MSITAVSLDRARRTAVIAAVLGGVLEWYDFAVYAFMTRFIGATFFPVSDPLVSVLTALAVFGVGFLARPIGALVIGRVGDTRGRRASLMLSIVLMTVGTVLIGILPGYASIGIAAPVLVVLARLMQGFSIGGEWGNAVAFLVEWAPRNRRGLYGSFNSCIASAGLPVGSGVAALITTLVAPADMAVWGWRIPFLLTAILGPVGYFFRRGAAESPVFAAAATRPHTSAASTGEITRRALKAFGITVAFTVATYIFLVFMPGFITTYGHLDAATALWINTGSGLLSIAFIPLFGLVSDKIGRKPQLLACCAAFIVLPYPLLSLLLSGLSTGSIFAIQLVLDAALAMYGAVVPAALAELFPVRLRTTWMSSVFALAVAIFGGFAAFIATWLIAATGRPIAPAFYVMAAGLVGGIAVATLSESFRHTDT